MGLLRKIFDALNEPSTREEYNPENSWEYHTKNATEIINNPATIANEDFSKALTHIEKAIELAFNMLRTTRKKYYQDKGKYEARLAALGKEWEKEGMDGIAGFLLMAKTAADRGNWDVAKFSIRSAGEFYKHTYQSAMLFTHSGFPEEDRAFYEVWKYVFIKSPNPSEAKNQYACKPNFANLGEEFCKNYIIRYGPEKLKHYLESPRNMWNPWYTD